MGEAMETKSDLVSWGILVCAAWAFFLVSVAAYYVGRKEPSQTRLRVVLPPALAFASFVAVTGWLAQAGTLAKFDLRPPPYFFLIVGTISLGIYLGRSSLGGRIAELVPFPVLIGAQAFRLPLELVMHRAQEVGIMPVELSFSGYNFDILTGASASLLFWISGTRALDERWIRAWNYLGLLALTVIAAIAILTSPVVAYFGEGSINRWVAYFPFVWLPAACVPFALAGHLIVWRKLKMGSDAAPRPNLATTNPAP